jgi:membrane-associated phospholipid phosphatase
VPLSLPPSSRVASTVLAAIVALAGAPRAAHADPNEGADPLDTSYLWDGGALPFFWGALGAHTALKKWGPTRQTPLLFSADEGDQPKSSWEVPGWTLRAGAGTVGLAIALAGDESKWFHVKGLAESMATVGLLTHALKLTFGRHRPYYTPEDTESKARQSFPSGHTTSAFAIGVYSALYLRRHAFERARDPGSLVAPVEALTYAGIAAGVAAISLERVYHNRHHVTDLLGGAILGTATSMAFFFYQEHRFQHREARAPSRTVLPSVTRGATMIQLGTVF